MRNSSVPPSTCTSQQVCRLSCNLRGSVWVATTRLGMAWLVHRWLEASGEACHLLSQLGELLPQCLSGRPLVLELETKSIHGFLRGVEILLWEYRHCGNSFCCQGDARAERACQEKPLHALAAERTECIDIR